MVALTGRAFGSFYRLHDRIVLCFTRKFWFNIQGKPILYLKGLSFGYFSENRYATERVTGCSVLFMLFALVSSFADKNRSWFSLSDISKSSQQQQLQETLYFTEGTCLT